MFRFVLSPRWLGFALFVVVLAGLCVRLGLWQWHQLERRHDRNDLIEQHFSVAPKPVDDVVAAGDDVAKGDEWTRVLLTGTYLVDDQVTVKFVTRDGAPGVDVVTPLALTDGTTVLVDRGWFATQNTVEAPAVPPPPTGQVDVMGWLRPSSGASDRAVRVSAGQVRAISSDALAEDLGLTLRDGYVDLQEQTPASSVTLAAEPEPELGQGPHFFYALQWWFFALLAIIGYFWFAVAESRERRSPTRVDGFAKPEPAHS